MLGAFSGRPGIAVSFSLITGSAADMVSRLATCRLHCRCTAACPTPISLGPQRMLEPCRNRASAFSRRGCRHTLQDRLTSSASGLQRGTPPRLIAWGSVDTNGKKLGDRLAVLPELLSAFDEHAEVLANQPPCGNPRSM